MKVRYSLQVHRKVRDFLGIIYAFMSYKDFWKAFYTTYEGLWLTGGEYESVLLIGDTKR